NDTHPAFAASSVFILDTIGQLMNYYAVCDIAFVGGSLVKKGGHNIIEPAACAKPVVFGPYMFNFRDITDLYLKNNAAVMAGSIGELKDKIRYLLENEAESLALGNRAKALINRNKGATARNLEYISGFLKRGG
ncbi:MAG: glycosyltransferase, partial [Candidatus Aenigmarchaeota archaeon]|nr:glycosyltransferase [Candidatus Aenigmarchaeota archaeon]